MRPVRHPWLVVAGALLGAIALLPGTVLEQAFGRTPHSLAWGPALFRTLLALHAAALILASFLAPREPSPSTRVAVSRKAYAVLGALTLLAIVLRIPSLDSCLWLDEVLTMARYARWPLARIFTSFPDQNQHMLFSLLAHCSLRVFGEHAWAVRLPSLLFGAGSLWGLFLMGRRLVGETEALIACALMTVSYHHIWFSQNARGYMGLLFFTTVATWLWLEAMERNGWRTWIGYAITIALGIWIHMTMLFVVAAHALLFLIAWLRTGRQASRLIPALAAFTLCGTLSLQLYAMALPEFSRTAVSEFSPASEWVHPMWVVREMLRSLQVGFAGTAVVVCGGLLVAAGFLGILRKQPYAAWAMVLPGVLGAGSMLLLGHNLWPRFFFFCMGFGLLIVIHGAIELPRLLLRIAGLQAWAPKAGYALAGLLIVASLATVPRVYALPKQDFTGARDYVEGQRTPADRVVVVGLAVYAYADYYAPDWTVAATGTDLTALEQGGQRVFLVYTLPIDLKAAHPDIWKIVNSEFETMKVFPGTLGGGEVYVCRERTQSGRLAMEAR
jgi:mannosyltransferase